MCRPSANSAIKFGLDCARLCESILSDAVYSVPSDYWAGRQQRF